MKLFDISFSTVLLRFYLLMGVVFVAFFLDVPVLAFLALPIFMTTILGVKFTKKS